MGYRNTPDLDFKTDSEKTIILVVITDGHGT
jgi:hypothetical protein